MKTPPAACYIDPARLAVEHANVFARSWQLVGHVGQLARPGDFFTTRLGHEPLTDIVLPVEVNRTVVHFQWFSHEPLPDPACDARWNELARFSEEVQAEDAHICEVVQLNIGSRAYQPGPYSPKRESGVRLFDELLGHS